MAKRNLSKKPKRKQLSRKMKRKTLNRKKRGGGQTRYRGNTIITPHRANRPSEEADGSLQNICIGLVLFVVFILLLAAASVASRSSGSEYEPYGGAPFQLPENLKSCIVNENEFNEFMKKVVIHGNMLTINGLTADEITILEGNDLLKQYIEADTTSVSFDMNNITLDRITFGNFIKKIGDLDPKQKIVDIHCIYKAVAEILN